MGTLRPLCSSVAWLRYSKQNTWRPFQPSIGQAATTSQYPLSRWRVASLLICFGVQSIDFCHLANYNSVVDNISRNNFGTIIKRQRVVVPLTLREFAAASGVSASHLGRIERGERFPSAHILRKMAKPLGFDEGELFMLAGYLSSQSPTEAEGHEKYYHNKELDPVVARMLAQEPVEVQRAVVGILSILRSLAKSTREE